MRRVSKTFLAVIVVGLGVLVPLQMLIDRQTGNRIAEEALYMPSGQTVKKISIGFDGLLSDIYWMRAVQYFGTKVVNGGLAEDSHEHFNLLYPLLDITTTLDPHYIAAYEFGGMFVSDYDSKENGIALLEHGIKENPTEWRLYQYLGLTYWRTQNYQKASDAFLRGSKIQGAPSFMRVMAAQMLAEGGSRATAREMFLEVYNTTDDKRIKDSMAAKLNRIYALDQIDCLTRLVNAYKERNGRYPANLSLRGLTAGMGDQLQAQIKGCEPNLKIGQDGQGMASDPDGFAFDYNAQTGEVALSKKTTISKQ